MICLMVSQSSLSMTTIFFYTCFWIPLLQMKRVVARVFGHVLFFSDCKKPEEDYMCCCQFSLPVARFEDLLLQTQDNNTSTTKGRTGQVVEETCSICLVEFEKEDVVSQLSKCGHVFHMDCIERWMDRNNFTCPLCRSLIFNVNTSHAKSDDDIPDTTTSSYINGFSWHY